MEDLTVLAPQTFRPAFVTGEAFEPDREKREHPAILDEFL
jgi:hypothetical protein